MGKAVVYMLYIFLVYTLSFVKNIKARNLIFEVSFLEDCIYLLEHEQGVG